MRMPLASLFVLVTLTSSAAAQDVSVKATAAKTSVTVGETFRVEVEAQGPPGTSWTFPAEATTESIDVRAHPEARPRPDHQIYDATAIALKDVALPPIAVAYRLPDGKTGTVETKALPLEVGSILPRDPKERQIADIRPPVDIATWGREFWLALLHFFTRTIPGLLLLAALVALAVWLWRKRRRRAPSPAAVTQAVPETPADVEAVAALDRLAASGLLTREEYRPFYIALSDIAKKYLERRLKAPIREMTSAETLAYLRQDAHGNAFVDLVNDVSGAADQIKFARGQGARERAEGHLGAVRRLVHDLERRLRPAHVEPPAGQGVSSKKTP
jgi:hypothetical protein